jgi:cobyrinic acid a,c-diamide synthase
MASAQQVPRIVVAAASSGAGKTTATVSLARAFRARGLHVAIFKCGPDYLDPTYHACAAGSPSHNLDGWMMGPEAVLATFARASAGADVALVEGVMGLFDGASPNGEEGSTAQVAKWLAAPVLLCVDASGMARSAAALVLGFARFDPQVELAGVLCNRVGGRSHLDLLKRALPEPPVVGGLPEETALSFPERHLGLHAAGADPAAEGRVAAWAERAASWMDLDAILAIARRARPLPIPQAEEPAPPTRSCRIGVAFDEAFHFYYEDNLRRLESLGAELVRFSPIRDARLPPVDGLYLGGGYPELHAEALSGNAAMREAIAQFAKRGGPVYAECGGFMYLCSAVRTLDGRSHPMTGVFSAEAAMCERLQALGYVEVETRLGTILGPAGLRFRGHEFRWSELVGERACPGAPYAARRSPDGAAAPVGWRRGDALGSYVHAHWASNPRVAEGLVAACAKRARGP